MWQAIEDAIRTSRWEKARRLIRSELQRTPEDHWLWTRLSLTYYEQFRYRRALQYSQKALRLAPKCPLVLWDYAGDLDMLGRKPEAMRIYRKLVRLGPHSIAYGQCGEGLGRARGLVADSLYRLALCYRDLGQHRKAVDYLQEHLQQRGPGCHSIYRIDEVRGELRRLIAYIDGH
jgi:predicted Zn-dependent protease